jgi:N-acetylglucosaminyldiphosphoundecaprenol N-acetyl-beta-D-mannosaminyltransferase
VTTDASIVVPFLDVEVTPLTAAEVVDRVLEPAMSPTLILNHNLHSVYMFHTHDWYRDLYSHASSILIDGWPVLQATRLSSDRRLRSDHRIGSTDWIDHLVSAAAASGREFRIFLLGTTPEVNERARRSLVSKAPTLVVDGVDGFFGQEGAAAVVESIRSFGPDLVLIGMGMPRQERFLSQALPHLPAAHYATVGGAIDFVGGAQRLAPRAFGRLGVEWLWRLLHDPKRLAGRYLVEPFRLGRVLAVRAARRRRDGAAAKVVDSSDPTS